MAASRSWPADVAHWRRALVRADERQFNLSRRTWTRSASAVHERALAATRAGRFRAQLVPITADPHDPSGPVIDADEGIREHLDPADRFAARSILNGRTTAANSSQLSDGAGALLIADREFAAEHGLRPRARFRRADGGSGRPRRAVHRGTRRDPQGPRRRRAAADIDLFEVNEAFAGVPLMFQREFGIDDDKLNVNGGSVALGHPLGSTGARMLTDLLCELERTGGRYGPANHLAIALIPVTYC